jgi:uncharacterized DUF497 family protein
MALRFSWDARKAASNRRKHGVSFEEATTAFGDPLSLTVADPDHAAVEDRFLLLGQSDRQRLLVVAHAERGDEIRIISARPATRRERRNYEEGE